MKMFVASALLVVGVTVSFLGPVSVARAQLPFGGMVLAQTYCSCSGGFWLLIGPPTNRPLLYRIGTQRYREYSLPRVGVWTLGNYRPGATCTIVSGPTCVALPVSGAITSTVGSSL